MTIRGSQVTAVRLLGLARQKYNTYNTCLSVMSYTLLVLPFPQVCPEMIYESRVFIFPLLVIATTSPNSIQRAPKSSSTLQENSRVGWFGAEIAPSSLLERRSKMKWDRMIDAILQTNIQSASWETKLTAYVSWRMANCDASWNL